MRQQALLVAVLLVGAAVLAAATPSRRMLGGGGNNSQWDGDHKNGNWGNWQNGDHEWDGDWHGGDWPKGNDWEGPRKDHKDYPRKEYPEKPEYKPIWKPQPPIIHPKPVIPVHPIVIEKEVAPTVVVVKKKEPVIVPCEGAVLEVCCALPVEDETSPPETCKFIVEEKHLLFKGLWHSKKHVVTKGVVKSYDLFDYPPLTWTDGEDFICACPIPEKVVVVKEEVKPTAVVSAAPVDVKTVTKPATTTVEAAATSTAGATTTVDP